MGFGDLQTASELRDVIEQIAIGVVNKLRPDTIVGKVFSINKAEQKAEILLPGESVDNLIVARFALDKIPTTYMSLTYNTAGLAAAGDIVRLSGKSGSYFILDFIYGAPEGVSGTPGGGGSAGQVFQFPTASGSWQLVHPFGTTAVDVTTFTLDGEQIEGDVVVVDSSTVRVDWGAPLAGYALVQE